LPTDPDSNEGRVLGIDPGEQRVGLAISDALGCTAQGLDTFQRGEGSFFDHIADLVAERGVLRIVVGLPRHLDGSEGASARAARRLAGRLAGRLKIPVELWDERLTTEAARRAFPPGSRKDWDRLAAVFILQSWLDAQAGAAGEDEA
jgi:putative holliday junction resolvase